MARAYSMDLRERVTNAMLGGATSREAAARFGVSVSASVKWAQRRRATGSPGPLRMGGAVRLCWRVSGTGCWRGSWRSQT